MSVDHSRHSLFGVSKHAADIMVQEYGRYFGINTGVIRGGCLTGPAQSGTELHGFLDYLVNCDLRGREYTIFGYKGKQVRDNIHSADLISAFWNFVRNPRPAAVYNMGGGRHSNCSMLEAIDLVREISGRELRYTLSPEHRSGDHIWWISDVRKFQADYPEWNCRYDIRRILEEIVAACRDRESVSA
jgi:CDP-paratose 2-epimerase